MPERKKSGKKLRRTEEKNRQLFESISDGFLLIETIFDESGNPISHWYLDANLILQRLTDL